MERGKSLEHKGYFTTIEFSAEDKVYHGSISAKGDLVSFEGNSIQEFKSAFEEAVKDHLETCAEIGKTPEKAL